VGCAAFPFLRYTHPRQPTARSGWPDMTFIGSVLGSQPTWICSGTRFFRLDLTLLFQDLGSLGRAPTGGCRFPWHPPSQNPSPERPAVVVVFLLWWSVRPICFAGQAPKLWLSSPVCNSAVRPFAVAVIKSKPGLFALCPLPVVFKITLCPPQEATRPSRYSVSARSSLFPFPFLRLYL